MADISWPSSLPKPRVDFRRTMFGDTMRSPAEAGYVTTRARFTKRRRRLYCTLDCYRADLDTLQDFFENDAEAGANAFNFTDPDDDVQFDARFASDELDFSYLDVELFRVSFVVEEV